MALLEATVVVVDFVVVVNGINAVVVVVVLVSGVNVVVVVLLPSST